MKEAQILELKPIGIIHAPYKDRGQIHYQWHGSRKISRIEVFQEFEEGLRDIEGFSHVIVVYWFHESQGYHLLVKTPWGDIPHGLFATRSPHRPCPLGLTVFELLARENKIPKAKGLDAIDGTPLLDIRPYIPEVDGRATVKPGWLEGKLRMERW